MSDRDICEGFEIEPGGPMSGCTAKFTGAEDCPVCGTMPDAAYNWRGDLGWVQRIDVTESLLAHDRLAAFIEGMEARVRYLEADNKAMWNVVFQAEDCVDNGCFHIGLEEAVEEYLQQEAASASCVREGGHR